MNRPSQTTSFATGPWMLAIMIAIAALSRLLPHPPNFSPVTAVALFGGAFFASKRAAIWVPLVAMLVSDVALAAINGGSYASYISNASFWLVYACIALTTVGAFALRGRVTGTRVLAGSLAGSALFFLVTNFGVWAGGDMYPRTLEGLGAAYVAGIPFFKWTLLGTLAYSAMLFGGFALLRRHLPSLRAQTT